MEDRREYPRVKLVVKVTNRATKEFHFFYSRDISEGGIFLETHEPYEVDTDVELDFFLTLKDKKERIVATGKVARTIKDGSAEGDTVVGMGVKFGELTPEVVSALSQYIRTAADEGPAGEPDA